MPRHAGRQERVFLPTKPFAVFAKDLVGCRLRAGLSVRELAARIHYSIASISDATDGLHLPTEDLLKAYIMGCGGNEKEVARWVAIRRAAKLRQIQADAS